MIDGTSIRAHRHVATALGGQDRQSLGRSGGGFSSKIHAKVDSFTILITAGQTAEITQAQAFIGKYLCRNILAGRGYDSNNLRHTYKERNVIERFFGRLKEYRRIATRYDKNEIIFKAGIVLGCIFR
ncbi:MAG: hypothetical protein QRY74_03015 [Chlamydia sp.]